MGREKGPNEVFCRSCGEPIKKAAEICPECGVRNDAQESDSSRGSATRQSATGSSPSLSDAGSFLDDHGDKFAWAGGIFVLLAGLGVLTSIPESPVRALVGGAIVVLAGLFALPVVRESVVPRLEDRGLPTSRAVIITIVVVGVFVGMAVAPATNDGAPTDAGVNAASAPDSGDAGSQSQSSGYVVRVQYAGSWQGALSVTTSGGNSDSQSVSGSGTTTIPVSSDAEIISANAQKQSDGTSQLTIQILHDGEVISEASTSSAYGVAQTTQRV